MYLFKNFHYYLELKLEIIYWYKRITKIYKDYYFFIFRWILFHIKRKNPTCKTDSKSCLDHWKSGFVNVHWNDRLHDLSLSIWNFWWCCKIFFNDYARGCTMKMNNLLLQPIPTTNLWKSSISSTNVLRQNTPYFEWYFGTYQSIVLRQRNFVYVERSISFLYPTLIYVIWILISDFSCIIVNIFLFLFYFCYE